MSTCKVILNNATLMDVTDTTAEAADVASGEYFYAADGTKTQGTASGGGGTYHATTGTWLYPSNITCKTYSDAACTELIDVAAVGATVYVQITYARPSVLEILDSSGIPIATFDDISRGDIVSFTMPDSPICTSIS